jgi:AraC family transcriptional regulator, alkane utilization regulator
MDALSDVLRNIQLRGAVYLDAEFTAPWCVFGEPDGSLCAGFLPDTERAVSFHLVTQGSCFAMLADDRQRALRLEAGDIVVVPQGDSHILGSATDLAPVSGAPLFAEHVATRPGQVMTLEHGGGGASTRMVCGFLASDDSLHNPLLTALPRLFSVRVRDGSMAWLESSLRFAMQEAAATRAGSTTVLSKLSELLFVEAVRRHVDTLPEDRTGWLAGLRDRFVGRALALMHARPAHPWTVENIAANVGLSRSALAQRFTDLLGLPPMQYLARWRLQLAALQLSSADRAVADVAECVGYDSEAAFSRAFKREYGAPPATWRRRRVQ